MQGFSQLMWVAGKAFIIALIVTPIVRDIFRSYNVVDRPGRRKVHAHPIPRVGGIAIAIAYLASLITLTNISGTLMGSDPRTWTLVAGGAIVFLTGLLDDFFDLRPRYKIVGQILATVVVFWNGLRIEAIGGIAIPTWVSFICTVLWLLLSTNALNLIDGLDGLCAGMGLLATLTMFGAALIYGNMPLAHATFPLAGALLGFLCYNFNPATVFLGDSGALLIGFLLGCYGMIWTQKSATLLSVTVPLLALSIPLLDVSLSVIRRFLRNRPIFGADRGHIHHRLLDRGLSPRRAVGVLYLASTVPAALALLLAAPSLGRFQALIVILFCAAAWFGIRQLRYSEFDMVGRLLFGGEFQRTVDAKLRLNSAVAALESATTDSEWWTQICDIAREMKWSKVSWLAGGTVRERNAFSESVSAWSFTVILSEAETLLIEGTAVDNGHRIDLIAFAEAAARTYAATRPHWQSAVVS